MIAIAIEQPYLTNHVPSYSAQYETKASQKNKVAFFSSQASTGSLTIYLTDNLYPSASIAVKPYTRELIKLFSEAPWTESFFQKAAQLNDVQSLLPFYKEISLLVTQKNYVLCNLFLSQVKVQQLSNVLLVGLIRLTSNWKTSLPYWSVLLDKASVELGVRGHNSKLLLKGLL